jgi:hypothetical protein
VVPRDEDDLSLAAEPLANRAQHGFGHRHRAVGPPPGELDHIAEQDQPLAFAERFEQSREWRAVPQNVPLAAHPEVKIRHDERPHSS